MSRRHVVALSAGLIATLLGGCTAGQGTQSEASKAPTVSAPSPTPMPLSHQTSFNVTLGAEGTKGTVRLEYSGFQGGARCNENATNGTPTAYGFYGPASKHFASWITGWVILSGEALDGTYDLAVMSSAFNSGVGDNTVTEVKGGKPYATQLANGHGRAVAGSVVPLTPGK